MPSARHVPRVTNLRQAHRVTHENTQYERCTPSNSMAESQRMRGENCFGVLHLGAICAILLLNSCGLYARIVQKRFLRSPTSYRIRKGLSNLLRDVEEGISSPNIQPAWRNGIRVCLKNRFLQGIEGSNPSTGITRLTMSTVVFSLSKIYPRFCQFR